MAAIVGNVQALEYFITDSNCNPACPGPLGLTPLHLASQDGHLNAVKYLVIEQQMEPLCEDEYGNTPLHRASAGGHQAVVEFLTLELAKYNPLRELMVDFTSNNHWNTGPLHIVAWNGHLDILRFFICDHNCDPGIPGENGRTLLHIAAEFGHLHMVKYLINKQGFDLSCLDKKSTLQFTLLSQMGTWTLSNFLLWRNTVTQHAQILKTTLFFTWQCKRAIQT